MRRGHRISIHLNSVLLRSVQHTNSSHWALVTSLSFSMFYLCLSLLLPLDQWLLCHVGMAKLTSLINLPSKIFMSTQVYFETCCSFLYTLTKTWLFKQMFCECYSSWSKLWLSTKFSGFALCYLLSYHDVFISYPFWRTLTEKSKVFLARTSNSWW